MKSPSLSGHADIKIRDEIKENNFGFFNQVYAWMCVGLMVTATVAFVTAITPSLFTAVTTGITPFVLIGAQLLLVVFIAGGIEALGVTVGTILYFAYVTLMGFTMATVFLNYPSEAIISAFAISAGTFGACSVCGMITKRDLTSFGSFALMGLIGLIIASVVNIFIANTLLDWAINIFGVLLFVGLTIYDTQKLKQMENKNSSTAILGSLILYLDFLNLFLFILKMMGNNTGRNN